MSRLGQYALKLRSAVVYSPLLPGCSYEVVSRRVASHHVDDPALLPPEPSVAEKLVQLVPRWSLGDEGDASVRFLPACRLADQADGSVYWTGGLDVTDCAGDWAGGRRRASYHFALTWLKRSGVVTERSRTALPQGSEKVSSFTPPPHFLA